MKITHQPKKPIYGLTGQDGIEGRDGKKATIDFSKFVGPTSDKFDLPKKHIDPANIFFVVAMILGGFFWLYVMWLLIIFIINL